MAKRTSKAERKIEKTLTKKHETTASATRLNSMTNWLAVLIFILPVLFSRVTLDPVITVRYIFLSVFILLFLLFFFIIKKINFALGLPVKIIFASGIAFGIWSVLSLFSAINPSAGYYETARHFLNLILLFGVFVTAQKEEGQILKLCKAVLLMSIAQSLAGILQYYDLAFTDLPGANAKPFGLMGNRNLFGSAQALVIPFIIFVLYKAGKLWKYLAVAAITGVVVSIVISQTRSAWLAATSIIIVSFLLVIIFSPPNRRKWIAGLLITTISIIALVTLLLTLDKENTLTQSVKQRAASLTRSDGKSESAENVNERIKIWKKTIEVIKDKPVLGTGVGNWNLTIPAYGTEGLIWAYGAFVPDRPHNVYLQVLSETGIPGMTFYFGMWAGIVIIAFKIIIKRSQPEDRRVLSILMLSGLFAFAVDCMFSFPAERIEHSLYTILMGGIILACYINNELKTERNGKQNSFFTAGLFLIAFINLFMGIKKYNFEEHMNITAAYDKEHRYQEVIDEAEAGKNNYVTIDQNGKSLEVYTSLAYKELKDFDNAIEEAHKAKKYNPNSAMVYNNLGTIYTDLKKYDSAVNCYLKALKLTPHFEILYKNLAVNYFQLGNYAACIQALDKVEKKGQDSAYLNSLLNEAKRRLALQPK